MDGLLKILSRCKCGVSLEVNRHRNYYESAEAYLAKKEQVECQPLDVSDAIRAEMVARDSIVELQLYADTPVGSYTFLHYDVEAAIQEAVELLGLDAVYLPASESEFKPTLQQSLEMAKALDSDPLNAELASKYSQLFRTPGTPDTSRDDTLLNLYRQAPTYTP